MEFEDRNLALRELRFQRDITAYARVLETDEALVMAIAAKRSNPPDPLEGFEFEGIAYRLQSYCNGTAKYVVTSKFDPSLYLYEPISKVDRVRAELGVSKQIELELAILRTAFPDIGIDEL